MRVRMYSHKGVQFEGEANSLNVKTRAGEITVLNHHHPLITILEACKAIIIKQNGERAEFDIKSGFLEMDPNNTLTVLVSV